MKRRFILTEWIQEIVETKEQLTDFKGYIILD